jgi:hypothetical protein
MSNQYILICLRNGLSNKIRTMLGYIYISEKLNMKLYSYWYNESTCECNFEDFFKPIDGITMINDIEFNLLRNTATYIFAGQSTIINIIKQITPNITREEAENELVKLYKKIILKDEINDEIQQIIKKYDISNCIGLHIRRTDHLTAFNIERPHSYTKDEDFFEFIEKYKHSASKIYLATDNYDTQKIFLDKYRDNIIIYNKIPINNNIRKTSIHNAIIDVYLLSHCKQIMGSYLSSFSVLAQRLKKIRTNDQSITMFPCDDDDDSFISN